MIRRLSIAVACLLAASCGSAAPPSVAQAPAPTIFAEGSPEHLASWGMVHVDHGVLRVNDGALPYALQAPLFSDYAQKLRTLWVPSGEAIPYAEEGVLNLPVGSVLTKTFYYPEGEGGAVLAQAPQDSAAIDLSTARLIETRVLVHREAGWQALTYVWNEAETDAILQRAGARETLHLIRADGSAEDFIYTVPNVTQCAACHAPNATTRTLQPLGPRVPNLNRTYPYADGTANQLDRLVQHGWLAGAPHSFAEAPRTVAWTDEAAPVEARARAYLDGNCAHCHNAVGPADTSGLMLEASAPFGRATGLCKLPVAAGAGTGNHRFDIVPGEPDQSVLIYRLQSEDPAVMMPEIGRAVTHREGVALLEAWIESMAGGCS